MRFPSGGQQQRVAIARALAMQPKVLLMDEPFGALDALTRAHLQDSLMQIHADLGTTVMMITHDVDEAVLLSDRIVMMSNGPAATIGDILTVHLPRPRDRLALAEDPGFVHLRQQVLQFLYDKQKFPGDNTPCRTECARQVESIPTAPVSRSSEASRKDEPAGKTQVEAA